MMEEPAATSACTVEVKGFSQNATEEDLILFFENENVSGGGPVKQVTIDHDKNTAVIVFEEEQGRLNHLFLIYIIKFEDI